MILLQHEAPVHFAKAANDDQSGLMEIQCEVAAVHWAIFKIVKKRCF